MRVENSVHRGTSSGDAGHEDTRHLLVIFEKYFAALGSALSA